MNFFGLSPGELLLILMLAMIVLGPEKLPEVAASIGKWIAEFRRATQELTQQFNDENPFAEIQRALNLSEFTEPVSLNPTTAAVAGVAAAATSESPPAAKVEAPASPVAPEAVAATRTVARGTPVLSDFFARTPRYPFSSDEWVHGSIPDNWASRLNGRHVVPSEAIDADWAHGVPVVKDPLLESILAVHSELEAERASAVIPPEVVGPTTSTVDVEAAPFGTDGPPPEGDAVIADERADDLPPRASLGIDVSHVARPDSTESVPDGEVGVIADLVDGTAPNGTFPVALESAPNGVAGHAERSAPPEPESVPVAVGDEKAGEQGS